MTQTDDATFHLTICMFVVFLFFLQPPKPWPVAYFPFMSAMEATEAELMAAGSAWDPPLTARAKVGDNMVDFPVVMRVFKPDSTDEQHAKDWSDRLPTSRLDILRTVVSQPILSRYRASQQSGLLVRKAKELRVDFEKVGPNGRTIIEGLATTTLHELVTNSTANPALAEVLQVAGRHVSLGEAASSNLLGMFDGATPPAGVSWPASWSI